MRQREQADASNRKAEGGSSQGQVGCSGEACDQRSPRYAGAWNHQIWSHTEPSDGSECTGRPWCASGAKADGHPNQEEGQRERFHRFPVKPLNAVEEFYLQGLADLPSVAMDQRITR